MEKLGRAIQKYLGVDCYILKLEGLFDEVNEIITEGFKMLEIDRFNGTRNLKNHVCIYIGAFQSRGLNPILTVVVFQKTLMESYSIMILPP